MQISSQYINNAINNISKLPGIGKRSAYRIVLHILKSEKQFSEDLSESIKDLRYKTNYCQLCFNISDEDICSICKNPHRQKHKLCIVENIQDIVSIENTNQYQGLYHVLGGSISPMQGIGPEQLNINQLIEKCQKDNSIKEIIFALNSTIEGDTTAYFISKKLYKLDLQISIISRGVSIGSELEYTDQITLGKSILHRVPYAVSSS